MDKISQATPDITFALLRAPESQSNYHEYREYSEYLLHFLKQVARIVCVGVAILECR